MYLCPYTHTHTHSHTHTHTFSWSADGNPVEYTQTCAPYSSQGEVGASVLSPQGASMKTSWETVARVTLWLVEGNITFSCLNGAIIIVKAPFS